MRALNKKGITIYVLLVLFATVVGFLVVWKVITVVIGGANAPVAEMMCHGGVTARNNFAIDYKIGAVPVFPVTCQVQYAPIDASNDKEVAMKEIGTLATKCWWQFSRGIYHKTFFESLPFNIDGNEHCFTCYTLDLKDIDESFEGSELDQWMRENIYTQVVDLSDDEEDAKKAVTYYDYISNRESVSIEASGQLKIPNDVVFEEGVSYSVVYFEPHDKGGNEDINGILITTTGDVQDMINVPCNKLHEGIND